MLPEDLKRDIQRIKNLKVIDGVPKDLKVAIQTFIEQAIIIGEYELETMPPEYLNNLLKVMSKYPEYNILLSQLIEILNKNELIE
tara:strand:- start:1825 stop:2079 length:255 start_codon:yes stop_codon:yes gene_type:complete